MKKKTNDVTVSDGSFVLLAERALHGFEILARFVVDLGRVRYRELALSPVYGKGD
jgi:hypothetical protein